MGPLGMPSFLGRKFDFHRNGSRGAAFRAAQYIEYHLIIILEENCASPKFRGHSISGTGLRLDFICH
jgi:hypothetical protein